MSELAVSLSHRQRVRPRRVVALVVGLAFVGGALIAALGDAGSAGNSPTTKTWRSHIAEPGVNAAR